jgi:hypothetical protein
MEDSTRSMKSEWRLIRETRLMVDRIIVNEKCVRQWKNPLKVREKEYAISGGMQWMLQHDDIF